MRELRKAWTEGSVRMRKSSQEFARSGNIQWIFVIFNGVNSMQWWKVYVRRKCSRWKISMIIKSESLINQEKVSHQIVGLLKWRKITSSVTNITRESRLQISWFGGWRVALRDSACHWYRVVLKADDWNLGISKAQRSVGEPFNVQSKFNLPERWIKSF